MAKTLMLLALRLATLFCQRSFVISKLKDTRVLLIDVQKAFIPKEEAYFPKYTPPDYVVLTLGRLRSLIELAAQMRLPVFVTCALSDEGDSVMPDQLSGKLLAGRQKFFIVPRQD